MSHSIFVIFDDRDFNRCKRKITMNMKILDLF